MAFYSRRAKISYLNIFFILAMCTIVFIFINSSMKHEEANQEIIVLPTSANVRSEFYEKRKSWNTSKLGSILFKNDYYPILGEERENKTFVILIWKRWEFLQNRHLYYFGTTRHDPFEGCSVQNCIFSGNDSLLNTADAVVVHLHTALIPKTEKRNPKQKWIYLDDESPRHSFTNAAHKPEISELANIFNWSMTYRSDADIPVPYGRTVPLYAPLLFDNENNINKIVPNWNIKRRDVIVAILISNCGISYRTKTIADMKKLVDVHVYGNCGDEELKGSCPGHYAADCPLMSQYLFYIVLENSKCKEYITEKLFQHAYSKGSIPIIQGPTVEDCERLLPPNSYLHFDSYANIEDLVKDIKHISENDERLLSYHTWRNHFQALNEHGYFGSKSFHLCRLCEAMNYNDMTTSVYSQKDLERFLDIKSLCRD